MSKWGMISAVALGGALMVFDAGGVFAQVSLGTPVEAQSSASAGKAAVVQPTSINFAALPSPTVADAAQLIRLPRPKTILTDVEYSIAKNKALAAPLNLSAPPTIGTEPQLLSGPKTPGSLINFDGDAEFLSCSNNTPADQALAMGDGSNPILQSVNVCISVWNTAGTRLMGPKALTAFFGLPAGTFMSDPRALYDWRNHRYIVIAIDTNFNGSNNYDVAVSQGDDPTGGWWVYRLPTPTTGALPDYPRLGQDYASTYPVTSGTAFPGAIYLASNLFANSGNGGYLKEEWLFLPKSALYNGQGFSYWWWTGMTSGGVFTDTSQPVNVWSPYDNPRAEFFITSKNMFDNSCQAGCKSLTVWAVSNPFGLGGAAPQVSGVVIPTTNTYSFPPAAFQPGGPNNIDTIDTRISGEATYGSGTIYAALASANGGGGTMSILYRVRPFLNTNASACTGGATNICPQITGATITNETALNYGGQTSAFFPVQQPDLEGNVHTVFAYSSPNAYVGIAYISQRVTQSPGSFADSGIYLQQGQGQYTQGRWGDYYAVSPAGVNYLPGNGGAVGIPGTAFSGMYAGSSNNWKTRIGYNRFQSVSQY